MTLRLPAYYEQQPYRYGTPEQKAAKREYDRQRRPAYADRKHELEQTPARKAVRTTYIRTRRTRAEIALSLLVSNARYRAKKNGLPFTIATKDLEMPVCCPVLGIPIMHGNKDLSHTARDCAPSIDRLDNDKGYIPGNVRIISWRANRIKSDATVAELSAILRYMQGDAN